MKTNQFNLQMKNRLSFGKWEKVKLEELKAGDLFYFENVDYVKGRCIDTVNDKFKDSELNNQIVVTDTYNEIKLLDKDTIVSIKR